MAIKTYTKGTAVQLSANFKSTEFDCHGSGCCSKTLIDDKLVNYLQKIRKHFGKAVNINSGYRCKTHNARVGGASKSNHMDGEAADIRISGVTPIELARYAESIGVLGIGVYSWGVHIDTRTAKYFWYDGGASNVSTFGGTIIQEEEEEEEVKIDTSKIDTSAADPKVVWNFLKKQGLNDYGIAGLMGNLQAESGLKPTNLQNTYEKSIGYTDAEYTAAVDQGVYTKFADDKAGYGLAQWTYPSRKQNMLNYHKSKNKSIGDLTTQLEFLVKELSTNYTTSVFNVLKTAKSVLEASNAVLLKFERPADTSEKVQNQRAALGQSFYEKYATKKATTTIEVPKDSSNSKMKYSSSNKPLACMQTQSTCYKGTSNMTVKGVLWHSTGANNPNLKRYVQPSDNDPNRDEWLRILGTNTNKNDWNHIVRQAGLNAWIGKLADGTVTTVQTMPWNYKPWGCGSGNKGSLNNGWIQFEICEDSLINKTYFNAVYKEACELTAYLCQLYNIDPNGTVNVNGVEVPTILCHADSYKLGLGSNHGDVLHWFVKYGKDMDDVRKDVAALMGKTTSIITPVEPTEMYRVRKTWEDAKSQVGAYTSLTNAKAACDKAGDGYEVYNSKGVAIYPEDVVVKDETTKVTTTAFNKGDAVKLLPNATWQGGKEIASWVFKAKLYVRTIYKNGTIAVSTNKTSGAITGVVAAEYLTPYTTTTTVTPSTGFTPYLVQITANVLNVRAGAGTGYRITTQVLRGEVYTIVGENGKWGKLKSGAGWISLDYTKKV